MRSVDDMLTRLYRKHPNFGIRNLMLFIVIGNVLIYLVDMVGPTPISRLLTFAPYAIFHGQIWRLVTFIFVPMSGNPFSLVLSLYFYWWVGTTLEREWGTAKFTAYYGIGVLMNIAVGLVLYLVTAPSVTAAAAQAGVADASVLLSGLVTANISYLNLSLFFAFATLFPEMQVLIFFLLPVKVKWLGWIDAVIFVVSILASAISLDWVGAVIPLVAILNYVLFFWEDIRSFFRREYRQAKHRNSRQTVNFKQATRAAREQRGYVHKCAVCGKTDTDYPEEEFRYCSKCNGYYCYCSQHIHDHVHIE